MSDVTPCPTCGAGTKAKKTKEGGVMYTAISDEKRSQKITQMKKALGVLREKNSGLEAEVERLRALLA